MADGQGRIASLDALRGIAALVVVIHHVLLAWPGFAITGEPMSGIPYLMNYTPLHLVWAGQEAVIIFFVLSGFVLSLPFWHGRYPEARAFIAKRITRLYPPYLVAITVAAVLMISIPARPAVIDAWLRPYWAAPLDWPLIRDHLFMLGEDKYNTLDAPVWSLAVEMQVSIIFPLMILAMRKLGWLAVPAALILAVAQRLFALPPSLYYLWLFVLGAELARRRDLIKRMRPRASLQCAIVTAALLGLLARWLLPIPAVAIHLLVGLSGALLILASLHFSILQRPLSHPLPVWLGRISYSLYLIHFVILITMIKLFGNFTALWAILIFVPFISVAAAELMYRGIEAPSIARSRQISAGIRS